MVVATANLTFKITEKELIAWVTDLKTGKPLPNVDVQFYSGPNVASLGTAKTDVDGLARFGLPQHLDSLYTDPYAVVSDGTNFGFGFVTWATTTHPSSLHQHTNISPH